MKRILLVCSAGMSTSLLVAEMNLAAIKQGISADIQAIAETDLNKHSNQADVVLLGPQVRFLLSKVQAMLTPKGVPVEVINSIDYGLMNGEKILDRALELVSLVKKS